MSPDGKRLVSGSTARTRTYVRVWDVGNGKELFALKGPRQGRLRRRLEQGRQAHPDRQRTTRPSACGTRRPARSCKTIEHTHPFVYQVALTPKEDRAVTCGTDRTVRIWDLETGKQVATNAGQRRPACAAWR